MSSTPYGSRIAGLYDLAMEATSTIRQVQLRAMVEIGRGVDSATLRRLAHTVVVELPPCECGNPMPHLPPWRCPNCGMSWTVQFAGERQNNAIL